LFDSLQWGVKHINVIAVIGSREGLKQLTDAHPDVRLTVGTVDETLKDGIVLPGLGDAGDRQFGTASVSVDDEESLLHPSKRKRGQSTEE
jgi:uracil phosphoribosyltransferase